MVVWLKWHGGVVEVAWWCGWSGMVVWLKWHGGVVEVAWWCG